MRLGRSTEIGSGGGEDGGVSALSIPARHGVAHARSAACIFGYHVGRQVDLDEVHVYMRGDYVAHDSIVEVEVEEYTQLML